MDNTPHAAHHRIHAAAEEDDEQPTPRIPFKAITLSSGDPGPSNVVNSVPTNAIPSDTPAATRLRALISRVSLPPPNVSSVVSENVPSEPDSDDAFSRLGSSTTSTARDNLRDLFSRALRDSMPQNRRRRRNSVDNSEIEISPVSDREEVGHQRKQRRSWSDEEGENPRLTRESDSSARSSHATTFNTLRARLASSQSQIMDVHLPTTLYDQSDMSPLSPPTHAPPRTASMPSQQLDPSLGTPPAATSTPQQSFQFPSRLTSQSNLLEQDSIMQGAVGEVLDSDSQASRPSSNMMNPINVPASLRPLVSANSIVPEPKPVLAGREPSSSDSKIKGKSKDRDHSPSDSKRNGQRERNWDRHTPGRSDTPNHHYSRIPHGSPSHIKSISHESFTTRESPRSSLQSRLNRRGSVASLSSFDDDFSSRPSSRGSLADNHELFRERNYERERDWNRPHPQSRPSSSLSNSSHSHAHLHPPRPLSATPYQTPTLASLQRRSSRSSLRSSSPTSLASRESLKEQEEEEKREITHERERNWNSPRPKWGISKRHSLGSSGSGGTSPPAHRLSKESIKRFSASSHEAPHLGSSVSQASDPSNVLAGHEPWHSDQFRLWLNQNHGFGSHSRYSHSPTKTPAAASKFGWHFHRQSLPPLEFDSSPDPSTRRQKYSHDDPSPPSSRPSSRASGIIKPSMIPVRTVMKATPGDGHSVPVPKPSYPGDDHDHFLHNGSQGGSAGQEDMVLASDEESIMDFLPSQPVQSQADAPDATPRGLDTVDAEASAPSRSLLESRFSLFETSATDRPLDEPHPEGALLSSQSPQSTGTCLDPSSSAVPASFTPPGTPPSTSNIGTGNLEPAQHGILSTPPCPPIFSSAVLHLRTPSPPRDLPDLPDPPSDDNVSNGTPVKLGTGTSSYPDFSTTKTPKPPGAWAVTPQQIQPPSKTPSPAHSSAAESTHNLSTIFIPLPRDGPPSDKQTKALTTEAGFTTPQSIVRTDSLPLQTPAPPGAWMRTPSQFPSQGGADDQSQFGTIGRRRSFLKVRFDVSESETSTVGDQPNSPLTAIRLSNVDFPEPRPTEAEVITRGGQSETAGPPSICAARQPATITDILSTPNAQNGLPIPRPLRKSPMVRVVDEYGKERHDAEESSLQDSFDQNDYSNASSTPGTSFQHAVTSTPKVRNTVRIVDAMGRDMNEQQAIALFHEITTISDDPPRGRGEAITRIKQAVQELQEGMSDADGSADELIPSSARLEKLEEVSKGARAKRDQLALNLQREVAQRKELFFNHSAGAKTTWNNRPSADAISGRRKPWNRVFMYCSILIQLLLILAMWRYAHIEARRLFYTTYYDPLYPELYSLDRNPFFAGAYSSHSWTMLDSWETVRREGWRAIGMEIRRAVRYVGDQVWDHWGEQSSSRTERPT